MFAAKRSSEAAAESTSRGLSLTSKAAHLSSRAVTTASTSLPLESRQESTRPVQLCVRRDGGSLLPQRLGVSLAG